MCGGGEGLVLFVKRLKNSMRMILFQKKNKWKILDSTPVLLFILYFSINILFLVSMIP